MPRSICTAGALAALLLSGAVLAGDAGHEHHHHHHQLLDVGHMAQPPQLSLEVQRDASSGWNVQLLTTNFRFSPERVNQAHVDGEGHAHLYVNGEKVARVYSNWLHLADLPPGEHILRATLNANSHAELAVDGEVIAATRRIAQP